MGGVLDDRDAELEQRIEIGRLSGEVDRHDCLRPPGDCRGDQSGIDVEVALEHVDEDRRCAAVHDHVHRRRPGDRRRDHFVAGPDPKTDQREVERGRAGSQREHMLRLEVFRHPPLELGRARPGSQPA